VGIVGGWEGEGEGVGWSGREEFGIVGFMVLAESESVIVGSQMGLCEGSVEGTVM
jgi:hypothetical protein